MGHFNSYSQYKGQKMRQVTAVNTKKKWADGVCSNDFTVPANASRVCRWTLLTNGQTGTRFSKATELGLIYKDGNTDIISWNRKMIQLQRVQAKIVSWLLAQALFWLFKGISVYHNLFEEAHLWQSMLHTSLTTFCWDLLIGGENWRTENGYPLHNLFIAPVATHAFVTYRTEIYSSGLQINSETAIFTQSTQKTILSDKN